MSEIDPDLIDILSVVTIYKYLEEESGENTTIDTRHKCFVQTRLIL